MSDSEQQTPEQQKIEALYAQLNKETSPTALDKAILDYAAQQTSPISKDKPTNSVWQQYRVVISSAATVLCVAGLAYYQYQYQPNAFDVSTDAVTNEKSITLHRPIAAAEPEVSQGLQHAESQPLLTKKRLVPQAEAQQSDEQLASIAATSENKASIAQAKSSSADEFFVFELQKQPEKYSFNTDAKIKRSASTSIVLAEVDRLLEQGKRDKAIQLLRKLVEKQPALIKKLDVKYQRLLEPEKQTE